MELSPVTVCAAPGNRITFTCSYISNQRLDIEFSSSSSSLVRREIMSDSGARYSWGATRQWTVVVSPDTRQVRLPKYRNTDTPYTHYTLS